MAVTGGRNPRTTFLSSILVIVVFIVLFAVAIWGTYRIVALAKPFVATFFSKKAAGAGETLPAQAAPAAPEQKSVTAPAPASGRLPDLSVRILSEGVVDRITGDIVPRPVTSADDLVAVRFDIANIGNTPSGPWNFSAQLPTIPPYTYASLAQAPLAPGAHVENMLRFTRAVPGGMFSVTIDPAGTIRESDTSNDTASQAL